MRFAIINDIHIGPEGYKEGILRKMSRYSKKLLKEFVDKVNNNINPEFVMVLGDIIENDNKQRDKKNFKLAIDMLRKINCPVFFLPTHRHDLYNLSENDIKEMFGYKQFYYSFDKQDYHFIVLFSKNIKPLHKRIVDEQILWLKKDLKKTKKKTIIFVHPSLADQNLKGNPWFEGLPGDCLIKNRKKIRKILEKSNKVIAVINSHLHWNNMNVHKKIPYFTLQSLIENKKNLGIPANAYTIVELNRKEIMVNVKGNYPRKFSYSYS